MWLSLWNDTSPKSNLRHHTHVCLIFQISRAEVILWGIPDLSLYPQDANVGLSASEDEESGHGWKSGAPWSRVLMDFLLADRKASRCVASEKQLQSSLLREEPFSLSLSLSLSFILSLCLICSSGHDVHQPFRPACSWKPTEMLTKIIVTYFHGYFLMLSIPVSGKNTLVTSVVPQRHVEWVTTPTWLSTKYCACSPASVSHPVIWMCAPPICILSQHNGTLFFFFFSFPQSYLTAGRKLTTHSTAHTTWSKFLLIYWYVQFPSTPAADASANSFFKFFFITLVYPSDARTTQTPSTGGIGQHERILYCLVYISSGPAWINTV